MIVSERLLHVELLLGRRVVARDGTSVGRIEEVRAARLGSDVVVTEYHVGTAAMLERLSALAMRLSPMSAGRKSWRKGFRIPWEQLDLSDPRRPLLRCAIEELQPLDPDDTGDDDYVAVPVDEPDAGDSRDG